MLRRLARNFAAIALTGRPSRRAIAAAFKLCGRRLERRWPFIPRAQGKDLNLGFDDLLSLQYARSPLFTALVVGAYDGTANDPTAEFIRTHQCRAVFVEPQPGPFERLRQRMSGFPGVETINAAIDHVTGSRDMYCVKTGIDGLPEWTEQVASFDVEHLRKHEDQAPGLSKHITTLSVETLTFDAVLDKYGLCSLDLLQIDAEGMDAEMLAWFPFHRTRPALIHYETVHMSAVEHAAVRRRLHELGYRVLVSDSSTDDMAIIF